MSAASPNRFVAAYARMLVRHPLVVLAVLLSLGVVSAWAATHLTINSNQLDLISQDLPEVKEVKRVVDMVGGAGHLMIGIRSTDEKTLKGVSDDLAAMLIADSQNVRSVTHKLPVEFIQQNMVLFIDPADLQEARTRINAYLKQMLRRSNPFYIELKKTKAPELNLDDLIAKYGSVGKRTITDEYNISADKRMILMLVKPMWDSNEIGKTHVYLEQLQKKLEAYGASNKYGVTLKEDYRQELFLKNPKLVTYGFAGGYKTSVDDSYAITKSLEPVSYIALGAIILITILFFRKWAPTFIVITGMVLGTIITMGFTYVTVHQLNMVTSILGGIIMGFGVDYGIHFVYRTRIQLGMGQPYDVAIQQAFINAGRPALISAVVTSGSFFMLLFSQFRGFSQFGLLAGFGTLIIGATLFTWAPALLSLMGGINPAWPAKLIGTMDPPSNRVESGDVRVPKPHLVLAIGAGIVAVLVAFAIPWTSTEIPATHTPTLVERLTHGIRFNYNTRALQAEDQFSVVMQDEINRRFRISSDPIAVYTKDLEQTREVYDELTKHMHDTYTTVDQVVSIFTFVPPPERAAKNAVILAAWRDDLKELDVKALPPALQDKAAFFEKVLNAKPFDVSGVPEQYASQFRNLPTSKYTGYLTYIYPGIDLWDGKRMLEFARQVKEIRTDNGHVYPSAGLPILFATLATIVLHDGKLTLLLTTLWILGMHFFDFRNVKLALASVIPLVVGLVMTLGLLSMFNVRLNFMNIIILPILLGFGVSHGLYLLHRFLEGTSPIVALRSVGFAVAASTLTAIAGFGALFAASHQGIKSMGLVAVVGLFTTLVVSFTVLAAVLQLMHDQRTKKALDEAEVAKRKVRA